MFQITTQQIDKRWDILPIRLLEILCSFDVGIVIREIGRRNHLTDEKCSKISGLTGFVLMGFIHPEDLAKEIKNTIGINIEIAEIIAKEIDRKIFASIKSEIDKISVLPLSSEEEIEKSEEIISEYGGPVMADIVKQEIKITKPKPATVEPMKIITTGGEEKIIIPGFRGAEPEISASAEATPIIPEEPMVIHKEDAVKPVLGARKSLGDLFGHLLGRQSPIASNEGLEQQKDSVSVAGQMEIGTQSKTVNASESANELKKEEILKPEFADEQEKTRVVHYENTLLTPILETGEPKPILIDAEQRGSAEAPQAPETKQKLPETPVVEEKSLEQQITEEEKAKAKVVNFSEETEKEIGKIKEEPKKKILPNIDQVFGFVKKIFKKEAVANNANTETSESAKETILQTTVLEKIKPTEETKVIKEAKLAENIKPEQETKLESKPSFFKKISDFIKFEKKEETIVMNNTDKKEEKNK